MSADLYTYLTIGLGMKNYPKMTPHMPYSVHRFPSYKKGQLDTLPSKKYIVQSYPQWENLGGHVEILEMICFIQKCKDPF